MPVTKQDPDKKYKRMIGRTARKKRKGDLAQKCESLLIYQFSRGNKESAKYIKEKN